MATRPNYNHLYHFWVIAQEGSLVGASRRLGVRHSTLSSQMQALEQSLGMRLLIRRPRGMRLTPQAEVVRSYCDQIFRLGSELLEAATEQRAHRLRVGMLPSVPRSLLYEALRPALEREAKTRVELSVAGVDAACRALVTGHLHVVFADRLPAGTAAGPVHSHLVGETRIGLFATARAAQRYRSDFPHSLDGAPMLLPSAGSPLREGLAAWFAQEGFRPRIVGEFDDVPMMKGFASRGHGVVPIRMVLAQEARHRYALVPVGVVPGLVDRLYALTLGKRVRHPGIQRLIDQCRGKFGTRKRLPEA
jgi:LysR family transcriptional activator of nhaA